jgi:hypothetical protein
VEINLDRYSESIRDKGEWTDFQSSRNVTLNETLTLAPKEILLLE